MKAELFAPHVEHRLAESKVAMATSGIKRLCIFSGAECCPFQDDLPYPFRANAYFKTWVPLHRPGCILVIELEANRPRLLLLEEEDYWHSRPPVPSPIIEECFEVSRYPSIDDVFRAVPGGSGTALVGKLPQAATSRMRPCDLNPLPLLELLDEGRARKTPWELHNIRCANQAAAVGHRRALELFQEGASELDIHLGYLEALRCSEYELPYGNIIAINENAAVLHHWLLNRDRPQQPQSLLIDAGASHLGYAADVTRTHAAREGAFKDLVLAMDTLQTSIAERARPGASFVEMHCAAINEIGALLNRTGVIRIDAEHADFDRVVTSFFPHGLGHFLGSQVHDRSGKQQDDARYPHLRLTRTLEPGNVVTIEPGLYFIPMLLDNLWHSGARSCVNWGLVEQLLPYGGIRVEDDLVITDEGSENLTRAAFDTDKLSVPA
ncbi:MAG: Xaa-Pro dipeptidase [Pseudomonadota bacterium]